MHVACEPQRRCCENFGALKLLCASAALVSQPALILTVDLEELHAPIQGVSFLAFTSQFSLFGLSVLKRTARLNCYVLFLITSHLVWFHETYLSRANVGFSWLSLVQVMRGETAIGKHMRLQRQAAELAEKIDFNACVQVLRTQELSVSQAKRLFESRGWWKLALQELMESSNRAVSKMRRTKMSTANPPSIRRSSVNLPL